MRNGGYGAGEVNYNSLAHCENSVTVLTTDAMEHEQPAVLPVEEEHLDDWVGEEMEHEPWFSDHLHQLTASTRLV